MTAAIFVLVSRGVSPLFPLKQGHPEVGAKGIHMKLTGDAGRGYE